MLDTLANTLSRESKRAIFTHGRIEDWFCQNPSCGVALDIDKRPPMLIIAKVNDQKIGRVILCPDCLEERGSVESIRASVKKAWFRQNPGRHDGDHAPADAQLMMDGTRPDKDLVDHITVEVL